LFQGPATRNIQHLHFTAWPDKGIPDDVTSLVEFRQRVVSAPSALDGPTLVHCRCNWFLIHTNYLQTKRTQRYKYHIKKCIFNHDVNLCLGFSAGIGRTGTYIALDTLTMEGEAEGAVEIPGCIINMRQNRINMVQTAVRPSERKTQSSWSLTL